MSRASEWVAHIAALLESVGFPAAAEDFVIPEPAHGDLALPCFRMAPAVKLGPAQAAEAAATAVNALPADTKQILDRAEAAGPYLNFRFHRPNMASVVVADIASTTPKKHDGQTIVLEYVSPNTNKPLHVGHLRNAFIGWSLAEVLGAEGARVVRTQIVNDRGIHIMKSLLAYQKWGNGETPESTGLKGDHLVGKYYVRFSTEAKESPALEEEAQELLRRWEAGDAEIRRQWEQLNTWAESGQRATAARIGIAFDREDFESDIYEHGKDIILQALGKGLLRRRKDGAVTIALGDGTATDEQAEKVLLRPDGTSVYITQDLALAKKRMADINPDRMLYVVGQEQDYHFNVLFEVLGKLNIVDTSKLSHVSYHWVFLPEGRMKSREGTVVDADNLLDELHALAADEVRSRATDISDSDIARRAEKIALAAAKYFLLRVRPNSDIKFNPKESIAFTGDTGPYLLYTYARAQSIFRKAEVAPRDMLTSIVVAPEVSDAEWRLVLLASRLPMVRDDAARELNPSLLADYAYTFARAMNDFYESEQVLTAPEPVRSWRLKLLAAASVVLSESLGLLGIETLDEM